VHIPDGFLSPAVIVVTFVIAFVFWAVSFRKVGKTLDERMVPMMALLTALFFAAMMMNYPIIGGTTAHLLGGASLGIILGPYGGLVSYTIILVLQALLFGDGGITALGANALNMGIIGVFVPVLIFASLLKLTKGRHVFMACFVAAFLGDVLAAAAAGLELGLSAPIFQYGISVAVPAMLIHHSVIGVIEGVVTGILVTAVMKSRPDILALSPTIKSIPPLLSKVVGSGVNKRL